MGEISYNTIKYKSLLNSIDIIIIVSNSADSNLRRTRNLYSRLKPRVPKADFYLIANFQDLKNLSFEPEKIEKVFNLKTYGFSAIKENADHEILNILQDIIKNSIKMKIEVFET